MIVPPVAAAYRGPLDLERWGNLLPALTQRITTNGYTPLQYDDGHLDRIDAVRPVQASLIRELSDRTPVTGRIIGLVIGPASDDRVLRLVA